MSRRIPEKYYDESLWMVAAFFNEIPDRGLIEVMEAMLNGVGSGFNDVGCMFPGDLDPWEEPFEGVLFYLYSQDDVIIDEKTLYKFCEIAARPYIREHFSGWQEFDAILYQMRIKYGIEE